ncbi:GDSL-type esterase/lipase family protein [Sporolactobacillus sp. Y61]|uniref:GDSL-type esterase/lipase family protein n=1 Tax=Sporolactobacillus sp. Y61 TaxID=3160863 RepID=A0AAU8IC36_9BACL
MSNPLYVALGDSLTVGVGSTLFYPDFVRQYHRILKDRFRLPVRLKVFARNGATTADILRSLAHPAVSEAVRQAGFITITGGGNDLLRAGRAWLKTGDDSIARTAVRKCLDQMERILSAILDIHQTGPLMIRVLNLYNPLFHVPGSSLWIEQYNQGLSALERFPFVRTADIYQAFTGYEPYLLSFDHLHPNPAGYRLMTQVVAELGFDPYQRSGSEHTGKLPEN